MLLSLCQQKPSKKQNRTLYAGSVFDFCQTFTLQPNLSGILPVWTPVMKS